MKKYIIIILLLTILSFLVFNQNNNSSSYIYPEFIIQDNMKVILQIAEECNIPKEDPLIRRAKKILENSIKNYEKDRDIIATVVYNEAGYKCTDRHMELVAAVIYNRLQSDLFPNTIYEIVTAPKQYHPLYAESDSVYGQAARNSDKWEQCQKIADKALRGQIKCPKNVYYQANFPQGSKTYKIFKTTYSKTWFCYG